MMSFSLSPRFYFIRNLQNEKVFQRLFERVSEKNIIVSKSKKKHQTNKGRNVIEIFRYLKKTYVSRS